MIMLKFYNHNLKEEDGVAKEHDHSEVTESLDLALLKTRIWIEKVRGCVMLETYDLLAEDIERMETMHNKKNTMVA